MEALVKEFISENLNFIIKNELNHQFLLHLITLYDAQQIDKEKLTELVRFFHEEKINFEEDYKN